MEVSDQLQAPVDLVPRNEPPVLVNNRMLHGPRSRSGSSAEEKNLLLALSEI
jgi:hypothetical protein